MKCEVIQAVKERQNAPVYYAHKTILHFSTMTSFMFPVEDLAGGARSKNDVAPFLSDIARATADSADALDLFKNLIEGDAGGPDSPGFMAFDAHGGEYV